MAMSTSSVNKAFAGKALTSAQKLTPRARVSRSAQVCKATQVMHPPFTLRRLGCVAEGAIAGLVCTYQHGASRSAFTCSELWGGGQ